MRALFLVGLFLLWSVYIIAGKQSNDRKWVQYSQWQPKKYLRFQIDATPIPFHFEKGPLTGFLKIENAQKELIYFQKFSLIEKRKFFRIHESDFTLATKNAVKIGDWKIHATVCKKLQILCDQENKVESKVITISSAKAFRFENPPHKLEFLP